jgi:HAD superfamily hydrolase (TIGR01459 family)
MRRMGIADDAYGDIMSSGEAVHRALRDRPDAWWAGLGRRVFHLGPERDRNLMLGLDLDLQDTPAGAEFVLNTGPDDHRNPTDLAEFEPVLRDCFEAGLKMICANPDLEVIRGGQRVLCAGALAQLYARWGGDVRSLGKPDPAIYEPVLAQLGLPRGRVLAVGDSIRTDIAGAAAAGLASCWVLGGLHGEALGESHQAVEAATRDAGLSPVASIPHFIW